MDLKYEYGYSIYSWFPGKMQCDNKYYYTTRTQSKHSSNIQLLYLNKNFIYVLKSGNQ